jgi:ELWxxDGT repeat protein
LKSGERVFVVTTGIHDSLRSLWRIDADGTVVNLGPTCGTSLGPPYLDEVQLLETRGRIVVGCGRLGEIWASDGTAAGTVRLMAAAPGTGDDIPAPFLAKLGDLVLMRGYDLAHGAEPWLTDGTVAGTRLLFDLNPGPRSSDPRWPVTTAVGTYFRAWDGTHGEEPWVAIP